MLFTLFLQAFSHQGTLKKGENVEKNFPKYIKIYFFK